MIVRFHLIHVLLGVSSIPLRKLPMVFCMSQSLLKFSKHVPTSLIMQCTVMFCVLKGTVHPKMKIMSSFTHLHVIPELCSFHWLPLYGAKFFFCVWNNMRLSNLYFLVNCPFKAVYVYYKVYFVAVNCAYSLWMCKVTFYSMWNEPGKPKDRIV